MTTLLDTLRALQSAEEQLQRNAAALEQLYLLGGATQADVRRFETQRARVYKMEMITYGTLLQAIADRLPLVEAEDLRRVIPAPQPFPQLLASRNIKSLPRGVGAPPVAAGVAVAPWVVIILSIAAVAAIVGAVFVVSSFAAGVVAYGLHLKASADATEARVNALQTCIALGRTVQDCMGAAETAVPVPPEPQKIPGIEDFERWGKYAVFGLVGVAGLTLLPVILGAFQSLRAFGAGSSGTRRTPLYLTAGDD
jgi:hypothetical protein